MNRRELLKGAAAIAAAWASPRMMRAQQAPGTIPRTAKGMLINGGGANIWASSTGDGVVLVDSGAPKSGDRVMEALKVFGPSPKLTLFNTHYHLDQTGNNEMFAAMGAKIIAHERTREWMANDYWVPSEDRYQKARPKAALPTQTFQETGSLKAGDEDIDYGYLLLAHTNGDIYVHFKNSNLIAVGDVASPLRDPALDWFTGAWIGGRVDAMDTVLKLSNDKTILVPAYGPAMTRAEFKAERDMMDEVRTRLFKDVREGDGPQDMLAEGVLKSLPRTWKDPEKFLYDAAKGLWAHHDKMDRNVV